MIRVNCVLQARWISTSAAGRCATTTVTGLLGGSGVATAAAAPMARRLTIAPVQRVAHAAVTLRRTFAWAVPVWGFNGAHAAPIAFTGSCRAFHSGRVTTASSASFALWCRLNVEGRCSVAVAGGGPGGALGVATSAVRTPARCMRGRTASESEGAAKDGEQKKDEQEDDSKGQEAGARAKGKQEAKPNGWRAHWEGLKDDYVKFPDIYNSANAINFIIFTVFCLASTGSNVEEKWWLDQWGVDAAFRPLAWVLHSFMTNNFLSMAFAMMLLHGMCHSVLPTVGSRGLMVYCLTTAAVSGVTIFGFNYLTSNTKEKQFGPWDIIAALYVMQYLHQGFTPFQILSSFNGWVRYACWVGQVCILYFDWQPTICGAAIGLALCKAHPRFKHIKPPVN